jgi:hypothetical protein
MPKAMAWVALGPTSPLPCGWRIQTTRTYGDHSYIVGVSLLFLPHFLFIRRDTT